jgi:glutamyl-tRNA reductase
MTTRVVKVGIDHRGASLAAIEALRANVLTSGPRPALPSPWCGMVSLATCHRVELYVEGTGTNIEATAAFAAFVGFAPHALPARPIVRCDRAAGDHLLRVAAGLESAVLGEDQVLSQVRAAYRAATLARLAGPRLHRLFHAAFRAGRRVRSETALGSGPRSLAACGVSTLLRRMAGAHGRRVLILGSGEMARLTAYRLAERGVDEVLVASRTRARAEALAAETGARAVPWEWRERTLRDVHGVVAATGADGAVIASEAIAAAAAGRDRPLVLLDLGVPRNLPLIRGARQDVETIDIESLTTELAHADDDRHSALAAAEGIVAAELDAWWRWTIDRGTLMPDGRRPEAVQR